MIRKVLRRKKQPVEKLPTRITNDTVAEHREKVLAGGRKLKYPLQYTRNRLIRNTILISLGALITLSALLWVQLYLLKDTSDFAYRITKAIPLPAAKIDGEFVRYSDYLIYHRTTVAVLESQNGAGDNSATSNDRLKFHKQQALNRALEGAYANKLAKEQGIKITDQQVTELINQQRQASGLSEDAYAAAVSDRLNWTIEELRLTMRSALVRREVAFNVDKQAAELSSEVNTSLMAGKSMDDVAKEFAGKVEYQTDILVPVGNSDGGLSEAAEAMDVGKISGAKRTLAGDGYYFVKRQESQDGFIGYSYIKVPLTTFAKDFESIKNSNRTNQYIKLD